MVQIVSSVDEILLFFGIVLGFGYASSFLLKSLRIPNVVVYLLIGFILANFMFNEELNHEQTKFAFKIVEILALGLIGYIIGTELKLDILKNEPKQLIILLLFESSLAYLVVLALMLLFTGNFLFSIILGGLATATAPAATVEILRKFRAKGPLTTRLQWILALDDLVAIVLVESTIVYISFSLKGSLTLSNYVIGILHEIGLAVLIGVVSGFALKEIVERLNKQIDMVEFTIAMLIFLMGIAHTLETSVITSCMILGATISNLEGENYQMSKESLEVIMSPILMIFFVFVGTRVLLSDFRVFPFLALLYLGGRTFGKIFGGFTGGSLGNMDAEIKQNIGFGLLAQGGVALGLMAVVNDLLVENNFLNTAHLIETTIIFSTFISDILGAFGTFYAITKTGERYKRVIK